MGFGYWVLQRAGWKLHSPECASIKGLEKEEKQRPSPTLRLAYRMLVKKAREEEEEEVVGKKGESSRGVRRGDRSVGIVVYLFVRFVFFFVFFVFF